MQANTNKCKQKQVPKLKACYSSTTREAQNDKKSINYCVGGLYCDDPGLGKTITALALILRTKYQEPTLLPHMKMYTKSSGEYRNLEERYSKIKSYYALVNETDQENVESGSGGSTTVRQSPRLRRSSSLGQKQEIFVASTTLIVVPFTLVNHWINQIRLHIINGSLTFKSIVPENMPNNGNNNINTGSNIRDIPHPNILRQYDIILTTFQQLSYEWRMHGGQSNLLKVHWLRVILDEGHELGKSVQLTNRLKLCCLLKCDRRWIMTGTPTPKNMISIRQKDEAAKNDRKYISNEVKCLQPLFRFLRVHPFHLSRETASLYRRLISDPYEHGDINALQRLDCLLEQVMIRSNKRKIPNFPKLKEHNVVLEFTDVHGTSYSQLVEVIQRNLMLADWFDKNHHESLLNQSAL